MNDEPHLHAQPKAAEIAAAAVVAGSITTLKAGILKMAEHAGDDGIIPDEVDGLINTVRRRFTDLWKEGKLRPTERTRKNRRGNPETVWILGRDEDALGAGAKIKANALRDARGAVAFLDAEYMDGRGVPGLIGWATCMKHLLDKAKSRVAELEA